MGLAGGKMCFTAPHRFAAAVRDNFCGYRLSPDREPYAPAGSLPLIHGPSSFW
jgi:hypothetical protein